MTVLTYLDKVYHGIYKTFNSCKAVALQHVDDILLCAETEEACSQASKGFLNFLADCGYKASREKAQLCQQSVRYLGLIISEGTRAIGPERIKPILNHPLPMTLRQLRGFLGITGYCRIWIPGYRVLFLPPSDAYVRSFLCLLYTLIKLYYTKALSNQALSLALD